MDDRTESLTKQGSIRHDWTREEVAALFDLPFPELLFRAQSIHREHFDPREVQISTLLSIKPAAVLRTARIARKASTTIPELTPKS